MYTVYWIHLEQEKNINASGYVGVTKNLHRRIKSHKEDIGRPVYKMAAQYGFDNLIIEEIAQGSKDTMYLLELELRPIPDIGWNIRSGGKLTVHSEASKTKISKAITGKPSARKGTKNTKEHTAKMVATRKARGNYSHTEETKSKISKATKYDKSHAAKSILLVINNITYQYKCIKECCDKHNLKYSTVRSRLRTGMSHTIRGYAVAYD